MVAKLNSIVSRRRSLFRTSSISWYWALFVALVALRATKPGTKPEVIVFDYFFGNDAREIRRRAASAQIYPSPSKHGCVCCRLSNAITDGICRACHHLQGYGERIDDIEAQLSGGGGGPSRQLEERGREGEREESAPSPVSGGRGNSSSGIMPSGSVAGSAPVSFVGFGVGSASGSVSGASSGVRKGERSLSRLPRKRIAKDE